jgi:hypothetical protein
VFEPLDPNRSIGTLEGTMTIARSLAVLAALVLWAAPAAGAAPASWNQEKVTQIATELAEAMSGVYDSVKKIPPPPTGSQRKNFYEATQTLRRLQTETRHLATDLKGGAGYDETLPSYKQIQMLRRDAAESGRSSGVIPNDTLAKVDKARDLLLQLSGYYDE